MDRKIRVSVVQMAPASEDKEKNIARLLSLVEKAAAGNPDFILLPELCTTPYWCNLPFSKAYAKWAEPIPGPATMAFAAKAKELGTHIILPIFERGKVEGENYNSAILIGPDGEVIPGTLPDGSKVHCYRKNNPGEMIEDGNANLESYYFRDGWGYPIYETKGLRVGILICRDRWVPEAWRVLALQDAKIIFVPVASWGLRVESFVRTMRTWAQENQLFGVGCNRAGVEGKNRFYGLSCIVGPKGEVIAEAPEMEPAIISGEMDLEEISDLRASSNVFKIRRPELYGLITERR
ncbi:MAG: carbon-nitrogen hydrolase family protein [Chloroflexi bacterium]|nr:carbon-nitrogen hydrolase family protein [Chloroflexota bacterium]